MAPPPPIEFGIEGVQSGILSYHTYNFQFLKMSDILKHVLLLNKNTDLLLLSPQLAPDEMAPSLKKHFRLALGAKLSTGCCCPSFSVVGVLNPFM
jgi:hypothetical protein